MHPFKEVIRLSILDCLEEDMIDGGKKTDAQRERQTVTKPARVINRHTDRQIKSEKQTNNRNTN